MLPSTRALLDSEEAHARGVYLAGPTGFNAAGLAWHHDVVMPKVRAAGLVPLSPWADQTAITDVLARYKYAHPDDLRAALAVANLDQGRLDLETVRVSRAVLAIFDGPQTDDGTALEVGYALGIGKLVVGVRTDIRRTSDNDAALVNLMLETACVDSGGLLTRTLDEAIAYVAAQVLSSPPA